MSPAALQLVQLTDNGLLCPGRGQICWLGGAEKEKSPVMDVASLPIEAETVVAGPPGMTVEGTCRGLRAADSVILLLTRRVLLLVSGPKSSVISYVDFHETGVTMNVMFEPSLDLECDNTLTEEISHEVCRMLNMCTCKEACRLVDYTRDGK